MSPLPHGLLILGTSHVGKSIIARHIGDATRWPVTTTDELARHPGRPWTGVPDAVIAFYRDLGDDAIHWFLQVHHANMRPVIGAHIRSAMAAGDGFILEGAALRPEFLAEWNLGTPMAICLTAPADTIRARIRASSGYADRDLEMRLCIDKFTERSIRENQALVDGANRYDIPVHEVPDRPAAARLADALIAMLADARHR